VRRRKARLKPPSRADRRTVTEGLRAGDKVVIEEGPLLGLEGSVVEDRSPRIVISVHLLRTETFVEVDRAWVRRAAQRESSRLSLAAG
jgi:transcription antitermination factor NusG